MSEMRRSSGSTAKPPSSAYAVDLRRASELANISYDELVVGIHTEHATRMHGLFMEVDDNDDDDAGAADNKLDALMLTSAQTSAFGVPLGLQELSGMSILEHSLSQLLLAGIDRVVVAVVASSDTRCHLEQSSLFSRMHIVFLEVMPTVLESVPETVLAARHLFSGHFLIHAADRVFDMALVKKFVAFHRTHRRVSLLVESDRATSARMSPSTLRVKFATTSSATSSKVHVGRAIDDYNGVDAGLYAVSTKVFMVLDSILQGVGSLSLAEALAFGFQKVHVLSTRAGSIDLWFGVDTHDQMVHAIEHNLTQRLCILPPPAPPAPLSRRASVIVVVESKADAPPHAKIDIRRASSRRSDTIEPFQGFVVDVPHLHLPPATQPPQQMQLLVPRAVVARHCALPNEISITRGGSAAGDEYMLAIPLPPGTAQPSQASPPRHRLSPRKSAFLVPQHDGPNPSFLLAVPDGATSGGDSDDAAMPLPHHPIRNTLRRLSALPSDVKEVALEAAVVGGAIEMQLTVHKSVPPIGYVILAGALLSVSSQGAVLQALDTVSPLVKMVWRYFGSSVLFGVLALVNYLDNGLPPTLSWSVARDTVLCSVAYVVFSATFIWALDHTSVGHAYIFSNSHSILLVVGKCMFGHPVAALEAAGALLGIAGGVVTSADHGSAATASNMTTHLPTLEGDIVAFVGAIGGVAYLIYAKRLKELLGVWLFCFGLFTITWVLLIPLLWAMHVDMAWNADPVVGFLGWTHHFGSEVLLVVVVSGFGTMGFITSMKYFPPLVVSVTMLLEPIVATVVCIVFGVATIPGWWTFVGGSSVLAGTLLVIISTSSSTEVTNVSGAMVVQVQEQGGSPSLQGYGACS